MRIAPNRLLRCLTVRMSDRSLIGSDIVIAGNIVLHLYESVILATTVSANGSIGIAALLSVFHWSLLTATVLLAAAVAGAFGQWGPSASKIARLKWLLPQQTLLLITAFGALLATVTGHYADGVPRTWEFISCDQFPRVMNAILYTGAIMARVRSQ